MFQTTPIPAFNDNYIWALADASGQQIAVVDPGDAAPVQRYLKQHGLKLAAILITHHHADHTGGVAELRQAWEVPVFGPASSPFGGIDRPLSDGDTVALFGQTLQVRAVPGHTLDHISYFKAAPAPSCSAAIRFSSPAAAACSKAAPPRCSRRWITSAPCRTTRKSIAPTNIRYRIWLSPPR
ncbi:MBL fold metallo-hydrolase [Marinobacterium aestuariivivens]|uniref:MBL fold metallo-hydrolase n=1 Tax=Marinobacterium aestuariivivens TaxID=1698799 RepID=A0ABW2A4F4_9GAMM